MLLNKTHYYSLSLCALMALLAFFDFIAFWFSAETIASLFLPDTMADNHRSSAIIAIFAASYLVRPLGGWLVGRYGDNNGRKSALLLSFAGIGIFTLSIGLLPTYAQFGGFATFLFVVARLGQGIAFSSQLPLLWIYSYECLPSNNVGFGTGIITAGASLSSLLLIGLLSLLESTLTQDELLSFGWRLPFLLGSIVSFLVLFLAYKLPKPPIIINKAHPINNTTPNKSATKATTNNHWQGIVPIMILSWFIANIVTLIVFLLTDLVQLIFLINTTLLPIGFGLSLFFWGLGNVLFGFLSDRINAGLVLIFGCIGFILALFGLFNDLAMGGKYMLIRFAVLGLSAGVIGAVPAVMVQLCSTRHRVSTFAVGYNISYAVAGAVIPTFLGFISYYSDFAPVIYLSFVCITTLFFGLYLYYNPKTDHTTNNH